VVTRTHFFVELACLNFCVGVALSGFCLLLGFRDFLFERRKEKHFAELARA